MARRRRRTEEPKGRDPSRMLLLSLNMILLAFFILLVALSNQDRTREAEISLRVRRAFQSFGGAFLGLGRYVEQSGVSQEQSPLESSQQIERFLGELSRFLEEEAESKEVSFRLSAEGLRIHVSNDFSFEPGSAQLQQRSLPFYNSLYNLMLRTTNPIHIEGHTDDTPLERSSRYPDHWLLSAARAMTVFRFFTRTGELPEGRFSVAGYADTRPLASNLTAEGRTRNRRVTITFIGTLQRVGEAQ